MLEEYIFSELQSYKPEKNVLPVEERDDLEVDLHFIPTATLFIYSV